MENKVAEDNRSEWLQVLEKIAATRPDQAEAEWAWVMKELRLEPDDFIPVYEVVRQGRWRRAENPAGYLKAAAKREAKWIDASGERKMRGMRGFQALCGDQVIREFTVGGTVMDGEWISPEEVLAFLLYRQESGRPMPGPDGVWRSAPPLSADYEMRLQPPRRGRRHQIAEQGPGLARYLEQWLRKQAAAGKQIVVRHIEEEPELQLTPAGWHRWANLARLSEWEKLAAQYKLMDVGWRKAMAEQKDPASRRALQAAWRKLERTGLRRLREAARKIWEAQGEIPEIAEIAAESP